MKGQKENWIFGNKNSSVLVKILRWVARIWGLFALILALLVVFTPDPYQVRPITAMEVIMLSFWGVAILGLILAWKWERFGAVLTLISMPVREVVYFLLHRGWTINFLLIWALVIPPALMFLFAWYKDHQRS